MREKLAGTDRLTSHAHMGSLLGIKAEQQRRPEMILPPWLPSCLMWVFGACCCGGCHCVAMAAWHEPEAVPTHIAAVSSHSEVRGAPACLLSPPSSLHWLASKLSQLLISPCPWSNMSNLSATSCWPTASGASRFKMPFAAPGASQHCCCSAYASPHFSSH